MDMRLPGCALTKATELLLHDLLVFGCDII